MPINHINNTIAAILVHFISLVPITDPFLYPFTKPFLILLCILSHLDVFGLDCTIALTCFW